MVTAMEMNPSVSESPCILFASVTSLILSLHTAHDSSKIVTNCTAHFAHLICPEQHETQYARNGEESLFHVNADMDSLYSTMCDSNAWGLFNS